MAPMVSALSFLSLDSIRGDHAALTVNRKISVNGGAEGSRRDVFVEWGLLLLKVEDIATQHYTS
jgi:hypothetical protein